MNHTHPSAEKPVLISKPGERVLTTAEPATHDPAASASLAQEARVKKAKAKKERKPKPTPEEVTAEQLQKLMADLDALNPENVREAERRGERGMGWSGNYKLEADEDFEIQPTKGKIGFWGLGEESLGPDEDYYGDDITSHGHGVLDEQRDLREYARMIAWELPLLNRELLPPLEHPVAIY
jgi:small subunit ribosomal protein S35